MREGLRWLAAGNASAWTGPTGNNTYLLTGSTAALIDAGVGATEHLDAVAAALDGGSLGVLLVTHSHTDHAAGVPWISKRWPDATVRGGGTGQPLEDGEILDVGGTRLRAIHTPGHAPDHFCFFDETSRDLFCGDLARTGGTIVIPASRGGSLRAYLQSLQRVRDLRPSRLLPAHGPAIDDPDTLIDHYVAHRQARHRQITAALAAGHHTPSAIVTQLYKNLPPHLTPAAEETVRAHLAFLHEGSDIARST